MPEKTAHSPNTTSPPSNPGSEHHDEDGGPHGRGLTPLEATFAPPELAPDDIAEFAKYIRSKRSAGYRYMNLHEIHEGWRDWKDKKNKVGRVEQVENELKRLTLRVAALATAVEIISKDRQQDDVCLEVSGAQEKAIETLGAQLWLERWLAGHRLDGAENWRDLSETRAENWRALSETMRAWFIDRARQIAKRLGLVAVDQKLVDEYRQERARDREIHARTGEWSVTLRGQELRKLIADAVLSALEPKP